VSSDITNTKFIYQRIRVTKPISKYPECIAIIPVKAIIGSDPDKSFNDPGRYCVLNYWIGLAQYRDN
jgi:hypothetical protein